MTALLLLALMPPAWAQDPSLADTWGGSPPPVSWTFVLETAGQARPVAAGLLDPIARFVGQLPSEDRVEILAVHTRTTPMLEPRLLTDANKAAVGDEIRTLETPSAQSSDLGAALATLTETLERDPAGTSHYVILVGSLCHSPPLGSAYADGGYGCRSIIGLDALDTAFDAAAGPGVVGVLFPIDLPASSRSPVGIDAVTRAFAPLAVQSPPSAFTEWLDAQRGPKLAELRAAAAARAELAGRQLVAEVTRPPTPDDPTAVLTLHSGMRHLGVDVTSLTVTGADGAPATVRLVPDATLELKVQVPKPPFSVLPARDSVDIPVKLHMEGAIAPTAALNAAGIDPSFPPTDLAVSVSVERKYGLTAVQSAAMAVSVLILGVVATLVARRQTSPPKLGGSFSCRRGNGPRRPLPIERRSEAILGLGPDGMLMETRREDAVLILRVQRLLWTDSVSVEV